MKPSEFMGIPADKAELWDHLHDEAWALVAEGNKLPHWRSRVMVVMKPCPHKAQHCACCCDDAKIYYRRNPNPEPKGHYSKGTPALRRRFRELRAKFEKHGFQPPVMNGYGWFHGGGVWF